jgi:hypothetical protein
MKSEIEQLFDIFKKNQDPEVFQKNGYEAFARNIISNKIMYIGSTSELIENVEESISNYDWIGTLGSGTFKYDFYQKKNEQITKFETYKDFNVYKSKCDIEIVGVNSELIVRNEDVSDVVDILKQYQKELSKPETSSYVYCVTIEGWYNNPVVKLFADEPSLIEFREHTGLDDIPTNVHKKLMENGSVGYERKYGNKLVLTIRMVSLLLN